MLWKKTQLHGMRKHKHSPLLRVLLVLLDPTHPLDSTTAQLLTAHLPLVKLQILDTVNSTARRLQRCLSSSANRATHYRMAHQLRLHPERITLNRTSTLVQGHHRAGLAPPQLGSSINGHSRLQAGSAGSASNTKQHHNRNNATHLRHSRNTRCHSAQCHRRRLLMLSAIRLTLRHSNRHSIVRHLQPSRRASLPFQWLRTRCSSDRCFLSQGRGERRRITIHRNPTRLSMDLGPHRRRCSLVPPAPHHNRLHKDHLRAEHQQRKRMVPRKFHSLENLCLHRR